MTDSIYTVSVNYVIGPSAAAVIEVLGLTAAEERSREKERGQDEGELESLQTPGSEIARAGPPSNITQSSTSLRRPKVGVHSIQAFFEDENIAELPHAYLNTVIDDLLLEEREEQREKLQQKYDSQRATLRPSASTPNFLTSEALSDSRYAESTMTRMPSIPQWRTATLELSIWGGPDGGTLILTDTIAGQLFRLAIPDVQSPHPAWEYTDVQQVHFSVLRRYNVLSLILRTSSRIPGATEARFPPSTPSVTHTIQTLPENQSPFLVSSTHLKGPRRRRLTLPGTTSAVDNLQAEGTFVPTEPATSSLTRASPESKSVSRDLKQEQRAIVFLQFGNNRDAVEWKAALQALSIPSSETRSHIHRRLEISILDLHEKNEDQQPSQSPGVNDATSGGGGSAQDTNIRALQKRSAKGKARSDPLAPSESTRAGWNWREKLSIEIMLDQTPVCRTTFALAEEVMGSPFWNEKFVLEGLREFSSCTANVYRLSGTRAILFAAGAVSLMPSLTSRNDERIPIHDIMTRRKIGELRMTALYSETSGRHWTGRTLSEYFEGTVGAKVFYELIGKAQFDRIPELFARIGIAEGCFLTQLEGLCRDTKSSWSTLLRGNSPLTKILESSMRLMCRDFLHISLGSTIEQCHENTIDLDFTLDDEDLPETHPKSFRVMKNLAYDCWADIYRAQAAFPESVPSSRFTEIDAVSPMRQAFQSIVRCVKEHHQEREVREIEYRVISSMLFLRLIGPALMSPHLFGLAEGLSSRAVQHTSKLLAKLLHALALSVNTDKDVARESGMTHFLDFILDNREQMMEFLSDCATPLQRDSTWEPPLRALDTFLIERAKSLRKPAGDLISIPTAAGPIDTVTDKTMLMEMLWAQRHDPDSVVLPRVFESSEWALEEAMQDFDALLAIHHREAIDDMKRESARTHELLQTPTQPSRSTVVINRIPATERPSLLERLKLRKFTPVSKQSTRPSPQVFVSPTGLPSTSTEDPPDQNRSRSGARRDRQFTKPL